MLPELTVPASLAELLQACRSCFSVRSFPLFVLLAVGMIGQVGESTVTGILLGSGLQRLVGHDRVHRFFAEHRWCPDQLGLALAGLIVAKLLAPGAAIPLALDDSLFRRRGKKVAHAHLGHDASMPGHHLARGNRWVILAIIVELPFCSRPVALPVLMRLWRGKGTASMIDLAREMIGVLLRAFPERALQITADAAYHGGRLADLPARASITTRTPRNAVVYAPAPPPTGKRGRPRSKGARLGTPEHAARLVPERETRVRRYGRTETVHIRDLRCLWYGAFGKREGRLVAARDAIGARKGVLYVFTTDLTASAEEIVERYAARWSIEVAIENAKQIMGVGQARNRVPAAVERTVPFGMLVMTIVYLWYALHGHDAADIAQRRAAAPWYESKSEPAFSDMLAKLRRTIIKTRFSRVHAGHQPLAQIDPDLLAWSLTAA